MNKGDRGKDLEVANNLQKGALLKNVGFRGKIGSIGLVDGIRVHAGRSKRRKNSCRVNARVYRR